MDIQPQSAQPISDDQELAKVLAGVNAEAEGEVFTGSDDTDSTSTNDNDDNSGNPAPVQVPISDDSLTMPEMPPLPDLSALTPASGSPMDPPRDDMGTAPADDDLSRVKDAALKELGPLIGKLNVSADEMFDTYLLLIRSTDDRTLIAPAHEAAKAIADETKRAQALYSLIKEIDFLSAPQQAA
ncbi:MAG: hypothetical protein ABI303_00140 [Candidatus Saccharimonas sp.]